MSRLLIAFVLVCFTTLSSPATAQDNPHIYNVSQGLRIQIDVKVTGGKTPSFDQQRIRQGCCQDVAEFLLTFTPWPKTRKLWKEEDDHKIVFSADALDDEIHVLKPEGTRNRPIDCQVDQEYVKAPRKRGHPPVPQLQVEIRCMEATYH